LLKRQLSKGGRRQAKHFGEACVLTVEDILTKTQGREAREAIEGVEKARKRPYMAR
jgi:hypothetical protein